MVIYIYTYIPWKITHLWMIFPWKLPCIINFPIFSHLGWRNSARATAQCWPRVHLAWADGILSWYHLPCICNSLELESVILHGICEILAWSQWWLCIVHGICYIWQCVPSTLHGICDVLALQPFMWLSWEFFRLSFSVSFSVSFRVSLGFHLWLHLWLHLVFHLVFHLGFH